MESLSLKQLNTALLTLEDILVSIHHLQEWNKDVVDFLELESTEEGMQKLAADTMLIEAICEGFKQIDNRTDGKLLALRPEIPWKQVKGMRDVIAHGYFDIDTNYIADVIVNDLKPLEDATMFLISYLKEFLSTRS